MKIQTIEQFPIFTTEEGEANMVLVDQLVRQQEEIAALRADLETERCLSFRNQVAQLEAELALCKEMFLLVTDLPSMTDEQLEQVQEYAKKAMESK